MAGQDPVRAQARPDSRAGLAAPSPERAQARKEYEVGIDDPCQGA